MDKKLIGRIGGGCGCFALVVIALWLCFVTYVGLQGRGNDEDASIVIGAVTCVCTIPIVILTAVALYFGLRSEPKA